jgi:molybdate transport system substrate-binding protein
MKLTIPILTLASLSLLGGPTGLGHLAASAVKAPDEAGSLRIAAAADLRGAFQELMKAFEKKTGHSVSCIYGSTGLLAKQAEQGAPFDILFAADEKYIVDLEKRGLIVPGTRTEYAIGSLAIWTRKDRRLPGSLSELVKPEYRRVAIANPEHAPYGAAAREALKKTRTWDAVEGRIVYGDNVLQALQYAQTGNADAAIISVSLAIGSSGVFIVIPQRLYPSIKQAAGVLKQSQNAALARTFISYICGPEGSPIMGRYGFKKPARAR